MHQYTKDKWIEKNPVTYTARKTAIRSAPAHTHDYIEIVYVLEGNSEHTANGVTYPLKRGDLLYMGKEATHSYSTKKGFSYFNVAIYPEEGNCTLTKRMEELATFFPEGHGCVHFSSGGSRELEMLLHMLVRECGGNRVLKTEASIAYTECFLIHVLRRLTGGENGDDVWSEVTRYIEENLDEDLSLIALSKRCFYNASYFSRVFKQRYHVTLSEYVMEKRLKKARELLVTTNEPIAQVIKLVGFHNKSFFYKVFQKHYGITPLQCRRQGEEWLQEVLEKENNEEKNLRR